MPLLENNVSLSSQQKYISKCLPLSSKNHVIRGKVRDVTMPPNAASIYTGSPHPLCAFCTQLQWLLWKRLTLFHKINMSKHIHIMSNVEKIVNIKQHVDLITFAE